MFVAQPIEWTDLGVVMLDQRRLPEEEVDLVIGGQARRVIIEKITKAA